MGHIIDAGGVAMEKTMIVHCAYSEDGRLASEILEESFRLFLQKTLLAREGDDTLGDL
jgi:hypothetical protein